MKTAFVVAASIKSPFLIVYCFLQFQLSPLLYDQNIVYGYQTVDLSSVEQSLSDKPNLADQRPSDQPEPSNPVIPAKISIPKQRHLVQQKPQSQGTERQITAQNELNAEKFPTLPNTAPTGEDDDEATLQIRQRDIQKAIDKQENVLTTTVNSTAKHTEGSKQHMPLPKQFGQNEHDFLSGVAYKHKQINPKIIYSKDPGPAKSPSVPEGAKFGFVMPVVNEKQKKQQLQKSPNSKTLTRTELASSFHLKQEISQNTDYDNISKPAESLHLHSMSSNQDPNVSIEKNNLAVVFKQNQPLIAPQVGQVIEGGSQFNLPATGHNLVVLSKIDVADRFTNQQQQEMTAAAQAQFQQYIGPMPSTPPSKDDSTIKSAVSNALLPSNIQRNNPYKNAMYLKQRPIKTQERSRSPPRIVQPYQNSSNAMPKPIQNIQKQAQTSFAQNLLGMPSNNAGVNSSNSYSTVDQNLGDKKSKLNAMDAKFQVDKKQAERGNSGMTQLIGDHSVHVPNAFVNSHVNQNQDTTATHEFDVAFKNDDISKVTNANQYNPQQIQSVQTKVQRILNDHKNHEVEEEIKEQQFVDFVDQLSTNLANKKATVNCLIDQIYKKERKYIKNYSKDNQLLLTSPIFHLNKVKNTKSFSGVEQKQQNVASLSERLQQTSQAAKTGAQQPTTHQDLNFGLCASTDKRDIYQIDVSVRGSSPPQRQSPKMMDKLSHKDPQQLTIGARHQDVIMEEPSSFTQLPQIKTMVHAKILDGASLDDHSRQMKMSQYRHSLDQHDTNSQFQPVMYSTAKKSTVAQFRPETVELVETAQKSNGFESQARDSVSNQGVQQAQDISQVIEGSQDNSKGDRKVTEFGDASDPGSEDLKLEEGSKGMAAAME